MRAVKRFSIIACGVWAATGVASAQTLDELLASERDAGAAPLSTYGAGPSELDLLSRSTQDEFDEFVATATRQPVDVTVRALNKVTAKYTDLTIDIDEAVGFGSLTITARYCDKRPPEEFPEATAFLQIVDRGRAASGGDAGVAAASPEPSATTPATPPGEVRVKIANAAADAAATLDVVADETPEPLTAIDATPDNPPIFSGWMFASSPALNALEHPVYDVWVIDCQTEAVSED